MSHTPDLLGRHLRVQSSPAMPTYLPTYPPTYLPTYLLTYLPVPLRDHLQVQPSHAYSGTPTNGAMNGVAFTPVLVSTTTVVCCGVMMPASISSR